MQFYPSFQERFNGFLLPRRELVAHNAARAGIPAQERVVVAGRADRLVLLEQNHRRAEPVVRLRFAARRAPLEDRLRFALVDDPGGIRALILIPQARQQRAGMPDFIGAAPTEL